MSKRKNRWKRYKNRERKKTPTEILRQEDFKFSWESDCHTPHSVAVGSQTVFICGVNDVDEKTLPVIKALDLFIGLDRTWNQYLPQPPSANQFVRDFQQILGESETIPNLIIHDIRDYSIDNAIAEATIEALRRGWKVGFGCIGGHGRSGWLLGRLIKEMEGLAGEDLKNAIKTRLCKKALEGSTQYRDLGINYPFSETTKPYLFDSSTHEIGYARLSPGPEKEVKYWGEQIDPIKSVARKLDYWGDCPNCDGKGVKDGYTCSVCEGAGLALIRVLDAALDSKGGTNERV